MKRILKVLMITAFLFGFTSAALAYTMYNSVAPISEPATMLLLGSGLVSIAGFGRKKFF